MQAKYADQNISFTSVYELYKGHKSTEVHSSYEGTTYSYGGETHQKVGDAEFVYAKDYFLKVNHDEKAIALSNGQASMHSNVDLDEALKECSSSKVIEKGDNYIIVFRFRPTSSVTCSVIKVRISKKDYVLNQMDLYYSYQEDFSTDFRVQDNHQPHLRIAFSSTNFAPKEQKGRFALSKYLIAENSILVPAGNCQGYELIDYRVK